MIASFRDKETEKVFNRKPSRKFGAFQRVAFRRLRNLHAAAQLADLAGAGNSLEALRKDRAGEHSIRVNERYRVCFVWKDGNAHDVEIVDYH